MSKCGWLFIVILFFALIINILFIIGFYYEFYNRCNHKDLINKIESEIYYYDSLIYKKVFCKNEYDEGLYSSKNLKPTLIVLNIICGLSLFIAYITFAISLYNNSKRGLKFSVIFPFFSIFISLLNISVAFYDIEPLPDKLSPKLSEEIKKEIKEAYISVRNINILVKFFSIGSLPLSIFCEISYLFFYNKIKKNEDERPLNQLLEEADKKGNNRDKNYPKNIKNNEILGDNLFEQNNN